jgi:hypothetical protein
MGKRYEVPEGLTIMKAMEYAGYILIRGCGCRGGTCGACGTVYRKPGDYKLQVALACQKTVEPDMYIAQIPFFPANRATYEFAELTAAPEEVFQAISRAVSLCGLQCLHQGLSSGNRGHGCRLGFEAGQYRPGRPA